MTGQQRLLHPLTAARITGINSEQPYQVVPKGRIVRCWWADNVESGWAWVAFTVGKSTYRTRRFALLAALGELPCDTST